MSETSRDNPQAVIEAAKAESRKNLAGAIWTGIKIGVKVVTLEFLWGKFLEHGGSQEELMSHQPEDFNQPQ